MDKADALKCCVISSPCLWNGVYDKFHCNLLSCVQSHSIYDNGENNYVVQYCCRSLLFEGLSF